MTSFSTVGLVLRLYPVGESDIILDFFTREMGRLSALAKGGKRSMKRFTGILLLGHLLELELGLGGKGGDLWRLDAAHLITSHAGLGQDFRRFLAAGPIWELLLRATAPLDPHPPALNLALLTLARLAAAEQERELASCLLVFLVRLLKELGYGLSLETCLGCGLAADQIKEPVLSLEGGLLCPACAGGNMGRMEFAAPLGLVKGLAAAATLEPKALGRLGFAPAALRPGLAFLSRFWQETVTNDLPSLALAQKTLLK